MAVPDYKINYKSDFVLTINGDAGWTCPFCIKFWTGMPTQGYFVGFDGITYKNCRLGDEPTKLIVMFDDHHLPIGKLKMQIAYHTTIEEFPGSVFDEVTNARDVIVDIDGTDKQVVLDFTGETAPELEFDLPAYANEAERIQNELQRQQNEAERIAAELQREQDSAAAVAGAENVNATLSGNILTVTNRNGVSRSVNTKGEQGVPGPEGPQGEEGPQGVSITGFVKTGETETVTNYNVTFSNGTTQAVSIPKGEKGETGATGATGPEGPQGPTGVSITGFVETGETETDTLYNVVFSNSTTQEVAIPKGEKGDTGNTGPAGPQGPMGDVAVITPEQQAAFTMYTEPGQNTNGPMTQKAVTDKVYVTEDITSLTGFEKRNGYISNTFAWVTTSHVYTTFIPCLQGDIFELTCSASVNYYAILKTIPNTGATGFSSRVQLSKSGTPHTIQITQADAKYLAIRTDDSSGSAFAPASTIRRTPLIAQVPANTAALDFCYTNIGSRRRIAIPSPITLKGWINSSTNKWQVKDYTYFSIIPVIPGKRMQWIYSNSGQSFHYAWLTDFNMIGQKNVTGGGTPSFVSGTTLSWTDSINDDQIYVPAGAQYLYVMHSYETSGGVANRLPTMYWLDMAGDMEVNDVYAKVRGKRISFLGDSITSYYNMPYEGVGDVWVYPNFAERGVMSPQQCWWGRLVERTGMILLRNASWKGSTCCGNSQDSSWKTGCSDARIALLTDGTYQPDIIMVFIGINDWIQDKELGTFNPRALVPADGTLNVFVDAYMKMIAKIQAAYTKARIFCCTLMVTAHDTHDPDQIYPDINDNGVSLYEFNQVIRQICDAMGVDVIELSRCGLTFDNLSYYADYDLIHPNSYGMELVGNKAEAELLAKY